MVTLNVVDDVGCLRCTRGLWLVSRCASSGIQTHIKKGMAPVSNVLSRLPALLYDVVPCSDSVNRLFSLQSMRLHNSTFRTCNSPLLSDCSAAGNASAGVLSSGKSAPNTTTIMCKRSRRQTVASSCLRASVTDSVLRFSERIRVFGERHISDSNGAGLGKSISTKFSEKSQAKDQRRNAPVRCFPHHRNAHIGGTAG